MHPQRHLRPTCWLFVVTLVISLLSSIGTARAALFTQCPAIGYADGCSFLITINPNFTISVASDPSILPFDNIEDTLIGVQNNSGSTVFGLALTGTGIFGLDGDGAGDPTGSFWGPGSPHGPFPGGPFGPTGYEGPNVSFAIEDQNSGVVNFSGGLAPHQSRWFSLEGSPTAIKFRRVVAVDPGHGHVCPAPGVLGDPTGAQDASMRDSEDDFVLTIANALTGDLRVAGYQVVQTRMTACNVGLYNRARLANNKEVDVFVSIHLNANANPRIHGSEVLVNDLTGASVPLAQSILQQQLTELGLSIFPTGSTGVEARPDIVVLNSTEMPAVLTEVAFISNNQCAVAVCVTDEQRLDTPSFLNDAATAIFDGINGFFSR